MITLIILSITHIVFLLSGIWIGVKNADSKKVAKGIDILKALKSDK